MTNNQNYLKKLRKGLLALIATFVCSLFFAVPVLASEVKNQDVSVSANTGINIEVENIESSGEDQVSVASALLTVGVYEDKYFTDMSEPEPVNLYIEADSISLCAECLDETKTTDLICCIEALDENNLFCYSAPFVADGSVTTIPITVPIGEYKVYFIGTDGEEIYVADVVFSAYV